MKTWIISDIHSNIEALIAVSKEFSDGNIYCIGDLVGYGASPNEVIEWVRDNNISCLMGNHDYGDYVRWKDEKEKTDNMNRFEKLQKEMGFKLLRNENIIINCEILPFL